MSLENPRDSSRRSLAVQCCIVGGGPAGMMLGYLLGRAGIRAVVLEKHADFFRDFRGDTVHPSTLQVMQELGLLGDFLNFLETKGADFPSLQVLKNTEAVELVRDGSRIAGVVAKVPDGTLQISADLTVACDGRHSIIREQAGLKVENIGAPIDVLWFRVGKSKTDSDGIFARLQRGQMMVTIDRDDYWQCAYVISKGKIDDIKARGLDAFRDNVASLAPILRSRISDVKSWDDVKLLTVRIDRLTRWALPGLLCIGDAAHAMSPVGGVGVNLAVQDAVAAANLLFDKFSKGGPSLEDLERVQQRRLFPARMTQTMQTVIQDNIINRALSGEDLKPPLVARLITAVPWLQGLTARLLGIGVRPEHVHSVQRP